MLHTYGPNLKLDMICLVSPNELGLVKGQKRLLMKHVG